MKTARGRKDRFHQRTRSRRHREDADHSDVTREIKRIASELDEFRFVPHSWRHVGTNHRLDGNAGGGHMHLTPGCGGAPVYHDICEEGGCGTRADVHRVCDMVIQGVPPFTKAEQATAAAVYRVALGRLGVIEDVVLSRALLPPDAGDYYHPCYRDFPVRTARAPMTDAGKAGLKVVRWLRLPADRMATWSARSIEWLVQTARVSWRLALADDRNIDPHDS